MLQEDENRGPRRPKDTLQVINLQWNSMDESLDFTTLWNLGKLCK